MQAGARIRADANKDAPSAKHTTEKPAREKTAASASRTARSSSTMKISPTPCAADIGPSSASFCITRLNGNYNVGQLTQHNLRGRRFAPQPYAATFSHSQPGVHKTASCLRQA